MRDDALAADVARDAQKIRLLAVGVEDALHFDSVAEDALERGFDRVGDRLAELVLGDVGAVGVERVGAAEEVGAADGRHLNGVAAVFGRLHLRGGRRKRFVRWSRVLDAAASHVARGCGPCGVDGVVAGDDALFEVLEHGVELGCRLDGAAKDAARDAVARKPAAGQLGVKPHLARLGFVSRSLVGHRLEKREVHAGALLPVGNRVLGGDEAAVGRRVDGAVLVQGREALLVHLLCEHVAGDGGVGDEGAGLH